VVVGEGVGSVAEVVEDGPAEVFGELSGLDLFEGVLRLRGDAVPDELDGRLLRFQDRGQVLEHCSAELFTFVQVFERSDHLVRLVFEAVFPPDDFSHLIFELVGVRQLELSISLHV